MGLWLSRSLLLDRVGDVVGRHRDYATFVSPIREGEQCDPDRSQLRKTLQLVGVHFRVSVLCPDCMTMDGDYMSTDVTNFKFPERLAMAATC